MGTAAAARRRATYQPLLDHFDSEIALQSSLAPLERACQSAIRRQLAWQQSADGSHDLPIREPQLSSARSLGDVALPVVKPPPPDGVSIAFLIMGHRSFARATIGRLLKVLWDPAHLFLLHLDARTNITAHDDLLRRLATRVNVRPLWPRRAVGWGAFSMVEVLLSALRTALNAAPAFDFFINLSDADVALRSAAELGGFLAGKRGLSFVSVKYPEVDRTRYLAHAHMRKSVWLECDGEGFVVVNQTAEGFFGHEGRRCCYARSGPIVYGRSLPIHRPRPPDGWGFYHGSQWVVLSRTAAEWLVRDPLSAQLARHMQLTNMADETFVQTALMNSPHRGTVVNHNLRYIDWPHGYGDPNAYWQTVGSRHAAGPMILTPEVFGVVTTSPAIFARKVDLEDPRGMSFMRRWDDWMGGKLAAEQRERRPPASPGEQQQWRPSTEKVSEGASEDFGIGDEGQAGDAGGAGAKTRAWELRSQPPIAATLLAEDASLRAMAPPPTEEEKRGMSDAEAARRSVPRPVHFGNEDVMSQQGASSPAPPPGWTLHSQQPTWEAASKPSDADPAGGGGQPRRTGVAGDAFAGSAGGRGGGGGGSGRGAAPKVRWMRDRGDGGASPVRLVGATFTDGSRAVYSAFHGKLVPEAGK